MFEFSELDQILMHLVREELVELSVDESGEFVFFCSEEQKDALQSFAQDMEDELDWT